jgi:hypothetical protein
MIGPLVEALANFVACSVTICTAPRQYGIEDRETTRGYSLPTRLHQRRIQLEVDHLANIISADPLLELRSQILATRTVGDDRRLEERYGRTGGEGGRERPLIEVHTMQGRNMICAQCVGGAEGRWKMTVRTPSSWEGGKGVEEVQSE